MIIIINNEINKINLRRKCQQSLLKSLMAVRTKDLLNLSVLQRSEMSLSLQLLLWPARMLWRGCLLLSKTEYNFLLIRCSTTALRGHLSELINKNANNSRTVCYVWKTHKSSQTVKPRLPLYWTFLAKKSKQLDKTFTPHRPTRKLICV